MNNVGLITLAKNATKYAHVPYSNFTVGAALLASNGEIFTGCNIENQGIMSICAERVAFVKALSSGATSFDKIAVVGKLNSEEIFKETLPCGYCRQFMTEFCKPDFKIVVCDDATSEIKEFTLEELLPNAFGTKNELN